MRKILSTTVSLTLVAGVVLAQDRPGTARVDVTVAVVQDGPSPGTDLVPRVQEELQALLGGGEKVTFKSAPAFDARWESGRYDRALEVALADRDVDIVLVTGALVSEAASRMELAKPVVSVFPQRADIYGIFDGENDRSLQENLSFVLIPQRTLTDLETFREIVPGDVMHVALAKEYVDDLDVLDDEVAALETALGIDLRLIPVTEDVEGTLAGLDEDVRGIVLAVTPRLDVNARTRLIGEINRRKIPTFSHEGHPDVALGALAARTTEFSMFLARRVALNLHEIVRGVSPNDLPVALPIDAKLLINGRTASQIGHAPGRGILVTAEFLYPEALRRPEEPLSLVEAYRKAEASNVNLRISTQNVETATRQQQLSKSSLLPQLYATASGETVKVPGLQGVIPDSTGSAGLRLNQMVYDDRRVSDYKSSGRLLDSTQEARELTRVDVLGETGRAYYSYVLSRVLYRVERDNLMLTRENLDLARIRMEAGYSGKDEVYRWEAQVHTRESELVLREADVESARVALNQVLGIDQFLRWAPEEREIDPEVFPLAGGGLDPYVDDLSSMAKVRDALVEFALENAPEMRVLQERIAALEIQRNQRKRRWYVPVFTLAAEWEYDFYRSPDLQDVDKDSYVVGVFGAYPIYIGGGRTQEIGRIESQLARLRQERELTRQVVERRTRTAIQRVGSSFPVIRLSRMAAESARKNFVVVQDQYTQGLVNVTDLLSAQNENFVTQQAAGASVYSFLQDLVDLQRAMAWFEDEKTPQEQTEFVLRIDQAVNRSAGEDTGAGRE